MSYLIKLDENEYNKTYDEAVIIYNNFVKDLKNFEKNDIVETTNHPMHPYMYYQLIQVNGFAELNGNDYQEYFDKWKERVNYNK